MKTVLSGIKEINKETFAFYNIQNTYGIPNRAQELGRGYEGTAFEKENGFTLITSAIKSKDGKKLNITTLNITNDNRRNSKKVWVRKRLGKICF